jgi:biotin carboxyl carrier protein
VRIGLRHKQHHLAIDVHPEGGKYRVAVDGAEHTVDARYTDEATLMLAIDGQQYRVDLTRNGRERLVAIRGETYAFTPDTAATAHNMATVAAPEIVAPMPGTVLQLLVHPGDHVEAGDGLLILEAMKMENRLVAEAPATVTEVRIAEGSMVDGGQVLVVLQYDAETPS